MPVGGTTGSEPFQNAQWAAARALGVNAMRVNITDAGASLPVNTLINNLGLVANLAKANRMYAIFGLFPAKPGAWQDDIPGNTAKWINIWQALSPAFKSAPHVIYEMVNEPTRTPPGGSWGHVDQFTAAVKSGLKQIYDVMRAGAPNKLILFPSMANFSPSASRVIALMQSFDPLGNGQPVDWTKTALAYHYYNGTQKLAVSGNTGNATDGGRAGLLAIAAQYPIICTETNWWMEEVRLGLSNALDIHEELAIGWNLLRRAGQASPYPTYPSGTPVLGPDFLDKKMAQLRTRWTIPVE